MGSAPTGAAAAVLVSVLAAVILFVGYGVALQHPPAHGPANGHEQPSRRPIPTPGRRSRATKPGPEGLQKAGVRRPGETGPDPGDALATPVRCSNTAIAGLEEIASSTAGSPPDLSQAVAHQKLGDIFRIIGRSAEARRHYDQSRSLAEDSPCRRIPTAFPSLKTFTKRTWGSDY